MWERILCLTKLEENVAGENKARRWSSFFLVLPSGRNGFEPEGCGMEHHQGSPGVGGPGRAWGLAGQERSRSAGIGSHCGSRTPPAFSLEGPRAVPVTALSLPFLLLYWPRSPRQA